MHHLSSFWVTAFGEQIAAILDTLLLPFGGRLKTDSFAQVCSTNPQIQYNNLYTYTGDTETKLLRENMFLFCPTPPFPNLLYDRFMCGSPQPAQNDCKSIDFDSRPLIRNTPLNNIWKQVRRMHVHSNMHRL